MSRGCLRIRKHGGRQLVLPAAVADNELPLQHHLLLHHLLLEEHKQRQHAQQPQHVCMLCTLRAASCLTLGRIRHADVVAPAALSGHTGSKGPHLALQNHGAARQGSSSSSKSGSERRRQTGRQATCNKPAVLPVQELSLSCACCGPSCCATTHCAARNLMRSTGPVQSPDAS